MSVLTNQPEIILELTGPLERAVGQTQVRLVNAHDCRLGEVLAEFVRQYPAAASVLGSADGLLAAAGALPVGVLVIRDAKALASRLETPVATGDRLTLMPMISGG